MKQIAIAQLNKDDIVLIIRKRPRVGGGLLTRYGVGRVCGPPKNIVNVEGSELENHLWVWGCWRRDRMTTTDAGFETATFYFHIGPEENATAYLLGHLDAEKGIIAQE